MNENHALGPPSLNELPSRSVRTSPRSGRIPLTSPPSLDAPRTPASEAPLGDLDERSLRPADVPGRLPGIGGFESLTVRQAAHGPPFFQTDDRRPGILSERTCGLTLSKRRSSFGETMTFRLSHKLNTKIK